MKLYHLTATKNLPSIRERGLVPKRLRIYPGHAPAIWLTLKLGQSPSDRLHLCRALGEWW